MDCSKIKVVKKDGTKEEFNVKRYLLLLVNQQKEP